MGNWYVPISFKGILVTLNLAQIRVMSVSRMYSKVGSLNGVEMNILSENFISLYSR